jgi:hypothetical protein
MRMLFAIFIVLASQTAFSETYICAFTNSDDEIVMDRYERKGELIIFTESRFQLKDEAEYIEQEKLIVAAFSSNVSDFAMVQSIIINTETNMIFRSYLMGEPNYEFNMANTYGQIGTCTVVES